LGMIFVYVCLGVVSASVLHYEPRTVLHPLPSKRLVIPSYLSSHYDKRTLDFDDPRLFSTAFGKRNGLVTTTLNRPRFIKRSPFLGTNVGLAYIKRADMDPRFISNSFGKRSTLYDFDDPRFASLSFGKRSGFDFDDPRFSSMSFGKRSGFDLEDPRFASMSFGKRSGSDLEDPRYWSMSFGKRR
uniref:Neuropeptide-Like Protein n=1 Tax=Haemonchus contortus TaxID=6289 RepID=A0A7I4Z195_HAECO